jgi:hypothetical protein
MNNIKHAKMFRRSTLLRQDTPSNYGSNDPQQSTAEATQPKHLEVEGGWWANSNRGLWRRKEAKLDETSNSNSSRPLVPTRERAPPKPATRSTYSTKKHTSTTPTIQPPHTNMEHTPEALDQNPPTHQATNRKLIATILEALLKTLKTTCDTKTSILLLGRIQGKHPGLKALTAWAWENIHQSLELLSLNSNNLFEVTFTRPGGGGIHTLN